jgi:hypothetical protein
MFEYLKTREIADKSAWLPMPNIVEGAQLELRTATMSNNAYYNAALKLAARRSDSHLPKHMEAKEEVNQGRLDDRVTFPGNVIVGWDGVVDNDGNLVPFSKENAADLVDALPDWMFDSIRIFALDPSNFVVAGAPLSPTPEEIQEKAGN